MTTIQSRVPRADYDGITATNISRLKELRRSPLHYQHALTHRRETPALTVGIATHVAVLEPERFSHDFAVWTNRTDAGAMSPRRGKVWDEFGALHAARSILTADEANEAQAIATAVRSNPLAMKYLAVGDPEVSMEWEIDGRPCKGRVDWLTTIDGKPYIVDFKTTRDCRHFAFGSQAAKLGYHLQFAFYADGHHAITGKNPNFVTIVVENTAPYAVAVYRITDDIICQGREEYLRLLQLLEKCEATGEWPGPVTHEEYLTLPSWAYNRTEDDFSDLELEPIL
jgi:PDDEXK-like domain of unknown function (DUF3799)